MEITQLRYFLEVAASQHMTASAERLHIAQPALSRAIHKLEHEIGVKLFEAKGRNIVLTECGKHFQSSLIPIISELDTLPKVLKEMQEKQSRTVRLNVLAASTIITNAIIEYKTDNKDIDFQLLQSSENDSFDIEITTKTFFNRSRETRENRFICNEKIFLAVPNNERFENRTQIALKEAENEGFISLVGPRQFRHICDRFCNQAEISPRIIFESDNPAAVKNMIAANIGVGFWPEFSWGILDSEHVKLLEITDPMCSRDILITLNKDRPDSEFSADFFEFLKSYFSKIKRFSESD